MRPVSQKPPSAKPNPAASPATPDSQLALFLGDSFPPVQDDALRVDSIDLELHEKRIGSLRVLHLLSRVEEIVRSHRAFDLVRREGGQEVLLVVELLRGVFRHRDEGASRR